eukprot:1451960-Rhodomonas_salina.1
MAAFCRYAGAAAIYAVIAAAYACNYCHACSHWGRILVTFREIGRVMDESDGLSVTFRGVVSVTFAESAGSGMNLMDLRSKKWHPEACAATAPGTPPRP